MRDATTQRRQAGSASQHKGVVPDSRTGNQRSVAPGKDTRGSSQSSRRIPKRDKKTGKFLPSGRKKK
jgi:hypothetical protein